MQASLTSSRAVMSLFHRGIFSSNRNLKMFSRMATPTRTLLSSNGSSVVNQMECATQLSAGRQLFLRRDLPTLQIGSRMFCDKTNRVVEVDGRTSKDPEKVQQLEQVSSSPQHKQFSSRNASNFDKRLLVYFGKYKTVEEVPELVSVHLLNATRNKFRVYVNIFFAFLTMLASGIMIYRGHRDSGHGDTLSDQNMRRHPQHYKKQEQTD